MNFIGSKIGHIRILGRLGEGGMGEVFVGFDEALQRKVAVKAIRPAAGLTGDVKARFRREAQILSQLDHPHICRIHDLFEVEDRDFLILELIPGRNLRQAVDEGLTMSAKLRVARQLLSALAAAHEKGIVHRDIKPDNVMLTAEGEVKVLDFGLARSFEPERRSREWKSTPPGASLAAADAGDLDETLDLSTAKTEIVTTAGLRTEGGRILGTPSFMSPEQARAEAATPASDMFSLGLLLQWLITEEEPYDRVPDLGGMLELVRSGESNPVSGLDSDLTRFITRLKSLAPASRPTAEEAAERLDWILARPRRRMHKIISVAILAVIVLAVIKYTTDLRRERAAALAARDEVGEVVEFLVDLFEVSDPGEARGNTITAREILDAGAERVAVELAQRPLTRSRLLDTIGTVYRKLGLYDAAESQLGQGLATRRATLGDQDLLVAESLGHLALLYENQGRYPEAESLLAEAVEIRESMGHPDEAVLAGDLHKLARVHHKHGDFSRAAALYERALQMRMDVLGPDHLDVAESLRDIGVLHYMRGLYPEAKLNYQRALAIREKVLAPDHPDIARSLNSLAALHHRLGEFDEAQILYERALRIREKTLGADHPEVATSVYNLAAVEFDQGHLDRAETLYGRALDVRERSLGPEHPSVATSLNSLAIFYAAMDRPAEAEAHYRRAMAIQEKTLGPEHPDLATSINNLGYLLNEQGRLEEAAALLERALEIRHQALGSDHLQVAESALTLATAAGGLGRIEQMTEAFELALEIRSRVLGNEAAQTQEIRETYAYWLRNHGQITRADSVAKIPLHPSGKN